MYAITNPKKIESRSFEIIDRCIRGYKLPLFHMEVTKRVVHATADLSYARGLVFYPGAVEEGINAIKKGKDIFVDSNMVKAGINRRMLSEFGGNVICLIDNKKIVQRSSEMNITRAILAVREYARSMKGGILAIGNAPTALFEICKLIRDGKSKPDLIIGVPVGFVGAAQAKRELRGLRVPYITNRGRKGGSSVAAAIVNALLILAKGDDGE